VAIQGKRYDGHAFIQEALQKGASGVLVSEKIKPFSPKTVLQVADTRHALGCIARDHRKKFSLQVIAVTGSNGKTTTKEMIAHLLSKKGPVLKNEGTKNNQIGVPLTLLGLTREHRFAVLELGMNAVGEIGTLSKIVSPTIGVITNIGPAHLEHLETVETVFQCKMELLEGLEKEGQLFLNAKEPRFGKVTSSQHTIHFFGEEVAQGVHLSEKGEPRFSFKGADITLPLIGKHYVENALAACSVASFLGISPDSLAEQFKTFRGLPGRMAQTVIQGISFIDDSYNANPESVRCALNVLDEIPTSGKRIFVMGDMLELGTKAPAYHREIGERVATLGIDVFITIGPLSEEASRKAKASGMDEKKVIHCCSHSEAGAFLFEVAKEQDIVLVKGSRGMTMEKVLHHFKERYAISPSVSS